MPNLLLESLTDADKAALYPHLKSVHLPQKKILFENGDEVRSVYFPATAVISLVIVLEDGQSVEAAMAGRDGMVGATAALDGKIAVNQGIVQLEGETLICDTDKLKSIALASPSLLSLLIRHEQANYAQAQQSAACFACHAVLARMCRWMLRARDLSQSDTLSFTQEFLAEMLGVRRNTVTPVAHTLQEAGIIKYSRGTVQIRDHEALEHSACECYKTVKLNYEGLTRRSAT